MRDLLILMRAPLAAGAASNVLVGALLAVHASPTLDPGPTSLVLLALGAACAYWAGMVWNDVFDLERDRTLAPQRPLPSGRVSLGQARLLGGVLTVLGLAATVGAGAVARVDGGWQRGLAAGVALAVCVLAYDGLLKRWRAPGSFAMGACRGVNGLAGALILLGVPALSDPTIVGYAVALTLYVSALTWLSTWEDEDAPAVAVWLGFAGLFAAPVSAGGAIFLGGAGEALWPWAGLLLVPLPLLLFGLLRRTLTAGTSAGGHRTTIVLLKSIWLFDFTAWAAVQDGDPAWLALPALWLAGRQGARALFKPHAPTAT